MSDYLNKADIEFYNPEKEILYKYVTLDTAKKILETQRLKFSNPDEFNDPFELTTDFIDFKFTKKELKEFIDKNLANRSRAYRRELLKDNYKNPSSLKSVLQDALDNLKERLGICCFSKNSCNTLMWSHYSDKHQGICLGFKLSPTEECHIIHVKYINELNTMRYWDAKEKIFPIWVFTKSHVWKYEEETRAVHIKQKGLLKFDHICLREIYYGLRTSHTEIDNIEKIISSTDYNIEKRYKMEINPKKYSLVRKEI